MRNSLVASFVLIALTTTPLGAQDRPKESAGETKLPLPPLGKASVGDWSLHSFVYEAGGDAAASGLWRCQVEKLDGNAAALAIEGMAGGQTQKTTDSIKVDELASLHGFLDYLFDHAVPPSSSFAAATVADCERRQDDHTFTCKKVTSHVTLTADQSLWFVKGPGEATVTLWLSAEVSGLGLVAVNVSTENQLVAFRIVGFGKGESTTWGDDGRTKKDSPREKASDAKVPVNAASTAEEGDWASYRFTSEIKPSSAGKPRKGAVGHEVSHVAGADVTIVETKGPGAPGMLWPEKTLSKNRLDRLDEFFGAPGKLRGVAEQDDKLTVAGRTFATKKVTFRSLNLGNGQETPWTAWFSSDVTCSGIVALRATLRSDTPEGTVDVEVAFELAGMGKKGSTLFGVTREALASSLEKEASDPGKK
jgi:hypothetical protein